MHGINRLIDHTILKPDTQAAQIETLCREATDHQFLTAFVNPCWVKLAKELLRGRGVKLGSVAGFPLGADMTKSKLYEAELNLNEGADELDMVMNVGRFKDGDYGYVEDELKQMRMLCAAPVILKVIIETALLTNEEKVKAALLVQASGADFVKTSTGFGLPGANVEDVRLLRRSIRPGLGLKASGGIRDLATAESLITAGADRIGTSASVKIMQEYSQASVFGRK
ncbi:MAG: deoxyribose-phosphate aldolase [candidate division Zixibacteria bacterium]|nr:deoxyribose-phosphate aldolase [candidate division Zixibacteria bacterium]